MFPKVGNFGAPTTLEMHLVFRSLTLRAKLPDSSTKCEEEMRVRSDEQPNPWPRYTAKYFAKQAFNVEDLKFGVKVPSHSDFNRQTLLPVSSYMIGRVVGPVHVRQCDDVRNVLKMNT